MAMYQIGDVLSLDFAGITTLTLTGRRQCSFGVFFKRYIMLAYMPNDILCLNSGGYCTRTNGFSSDVVW
jgi:hypothetical protein